MFNMNPITACDFYKIGHVFQYPEGTELIYSNFTARSGKHFGRKIDGVVNFGLQGVLKEIDRWFNDEFFGVSEDFAVREFEETMKSTIGPINSDHIRALHKYGKLPIIVSALPEGAIVPFGVPLFTIHNSKPEFYWVTNFLETMISAELWPKVTIATIAFEYRKMLERAADETGSPKDFVLWQGHDFSMRGLPGVAAAKNSSGHLVSFLGTDTIPAIEYLSNYYHGYNTFVGGSVPATEHSVMCAGGKNSEEETIRRIIQDVYPSGVVSVVSDTWDFWKTITVHAKNLKDVIEARTPDALGLAKVVFRPDSGNPADIICGQPVVDAVDVDDACEYLYDKVAEEAPHGEQGDDCPYGYFMIDGEVRRIEIYVDWNRYDKQYYYVDGWKLTSNLPDDRTPAQRGALDCLWEIFGGTINEKGYKVLNPRVGLIYGDSITLDIAQEILDRMKAKGYASCNIVFGIGSFTYQMITRDTFGMAMKSTYARVKGEERMLFKDPVTDSGTKKSARGLLTVIKNSQGQYQLVDSHDIVSYTDFINKDMDQLDLVYNEGYFAKTHTLEEVRKRINSYL